MKTRTIAVTLMLTFTSGALFAQSTDTIPKKTDTTKKDTVSLLNNVRTNSLLKTISKDNPGMMQDQTAYALPAKALRISQLKTVATSEK